jgi:predicted nucleic acid-binding protein
VHPLKHKNFAILNEFDEVFVDCVFLQLGRREYDVAAALRATHGLDTLDAIHLGVAINGGCSEFWTNDRRFAAAAKASSIAVREFQLAEAIPR